jgi:hypothetical protein
MMRDTSLRRNVKSLPSPLVRRCALVSLSSFALLTTACGTSHDGGSKADGGSSNTLEPIEACYGSFSVELRSFLDGPTSTGGPQSVPAYLFVGGQLYDGPYPSAFVETALDAPDDATEGCAVYSVSAPSCVDIGGCRSGSQDEACAAAKSDEPCVCVAQNECQRFPKRVGAGTVTVNGVADKNGATSWELENLSDSYQVPAKRALSYPGFAPGDPIGIAASGGGCPGFHLDSTGVAPLSFTKDSYRLAWDPDKADKRAYAAFEMEWDPPATPGSSEIHVEVDISHHGGTVGFLACELEDTGSLSISGGLISQLVALGGIGGYPELSIERTTTTSVDVGEGEVELEVGSAKEFILTMDGFKSCLANDDCAADEVCNRTIKLCQPGK